MGEEERTSELLLAEVAFEVLEVVLDLLSGGGDCHGDNLACNDGLFTSAAHETKMMIVVVLAEGISVLGRVELASQLLLANRADEVIWMVRFVQCVDSRALNGFLTVTTGGAECLLPVFNAIRVSVHALANLAIFELALAYFAQKMIQMPGHIEGFQDRAINRLLASATSTTVLHDDTEENAVATPSPLPSLGVIALPTPHSSSSSVSLCIEHVICRRFLAIRCSTYADEIHISMAQPPASRTRLPQDPFDDVSMNSSHDVVTQSIDDASGDEGALVAQGRSDNPRQVFEFATSRSVSTHEPERDMEVSTQVLDTLDALDAAFMAEKPFASQEMDTEGAAPQAEPVADLLPSELTVKRPLPEWMTSTAPVVTRRSLYLGTQNRHRKKQALLDAEETEPVASSKYPYVDVAKPSDMCLDRVICFDVESTGFASTDGIIEIGAVEYILGQRSGVMFQSYIKPSVPVNQHAAEVHGITNMMLASAPPANVIIPSFLSWVGSSPLVAHNARFDMRMCVSYTSMTCYRYHPLVEVC